MAAPKEIEELVAKFEMHYGAYRSPQYKEAEVRSGFIDPLFKALGWDVNNEHGALRGMQRGYREPSLQSENASKLLITNFV